MPISPSFTWTESEDGLEVVVELQGASRSKADVFATDCMLKVNSSPYLLILDLFGEVDDDQSVVTILQQSIVFRLVKAAKCRGLWGQLEPVGATNDEVHARRNASIDRAHAKIEMQRKAKQERRDRERKEATDRQIEADRRRRQAVEDAKRRELESERADLSAWQKKIGNQGDESDYESEEDEEDTGSANAGPGARSKEAMPDHPDYHGRGWRGASAQQQQQRDNNGVPKHGSSRATDGALLELESDGDDDGEGDGRGAAPARGGDSGSDDVDGGSTDVAPRRPPVSFKPLPPPRIKLEPVRIEFTKLETGHLPAREHREEEIRLYKKQQYGALGDSVDVADRQPVFLKDKGDALYKQGNFRGAINAYARALEVDPDNFPQAPAVWANSAACFLQLKEHEHCVNASSKALELLQPRVRAMDEGRLDASDAASLSRQLLKSLTRRAQARAALGLLAEAEADYSEALRHAGDGAGAGADAIRADLSELRAAMAPADADALRTRGAARFQARDYEGAVHAFSLLLAMMAAPGRAPERGDGAAEAASASAGGASACAAASRADERVCVLSNRAAALLALERYAEAAADCTAALAVHTAAVRGAAAVPCEGGDAGAADGAAAGVSSSGAGAGRGDAAPDAGQLRALLAGLGGHWPLEPARAAAASRLAARRGAAFAHAKSFGDSALDYASAAELAGWAGDSARQEQLLADAERCRALAASSC